MRLQFQQSVAGKLVQVLVFCAALGFGVTMATASPETFLHNDSKTGSDGEFGTLRDAINAANGEMVSGRGGMSSGPDPGLGGANYALGVSDFQADGGPDLVVGPGEHDANCWGTGAAIMVPTFLVTGDPNITTLTTFNFGGTLTDRGTLIIVGQTLSGTGTFINNPLTGVLTFNVPNANAYGFTAGLTGSATPAGMVTFDANFVGGTPASGTGVGPVTLLPQDGCTPQAPIVGDPISAATGEVHNRFAPDLNLGGGPLGLRFQRYYGSLLNYNGITSALGANWMHNFDVRLVLYGTGNTNATILRFGGKTVRFNQTGGAWKIVGQEQYPDQLVQASGEYRYTSVHDNLIYAFDGTGSLIRIQDRNGNQITVTPGPNGPTQASDGLGRTLAFTYTGSALTKVTDQSGRFVSFGQTGRDLTTLADALGKTTTFTYASAVTGSVLVSTTLPLGNKSFTQTLDAQGRAIKQTDGLGDVLSVVYSNGSTTTTDALGNKSTLTFGAPGVANPAVTVSGYTDALGKSSTIAYDSASRPTVTTDRNGNKRTYTYDAASGYPATITDESGNKATYTYTASPSGGFYDLTGVTFADGTQTTLAYDASGNLTRRIDAGGNATALTYNARGQVLTIVNPVNGTATYTYNSDGSVASIKSLAGDITSYSYDSLKRISQIKRPDGNTVNLVYDALDRVVQRTNERSKASKAAYTDNGKLASVTDALANTTSQTYDAAENLATATSPSGTSRVSYNGADLPKTVTSPTGETLNFAYDSNLRASGVSDAAGAIATYAYDAEDRLTSVTDGAARKWTLTPDATGLVTSIKTPLGETWQQTFDKRRRITSVKDPLGQSATFTYDPRGLLIGITSPGPLQASYARSALGLITSISDSNGGVWARTYDNMGRITSKKDPAGGSIGYTYDSRNRLSGATSSVATVQFTYDAAGNLTRRLFSDGTDMSYSFDDANRATGGTGVSLTRDASGMIVGSNGLAITRDASGRMASIVYPSGSVTYTYNNRGLLSTVTDWAGGATSFAYNAASQLASVNRPNGVRTTYTYDGNGRLSGVTESAGAVLSSILLQRDAAGKVTSEDRAQPQSPLPAPGVQSMTYDRANQLAGATYDGLGRLTKDSLRSYAYDAASRLTSYQGADGAASFTYDAYGMRISRTTAEGTENYVINYSTGLPSVAVVQGGGADQRYYIYTPDGILLYAIDPSSKQRRFFHFDEAGNTMFLTDDGGAVKQSYGISAYGESVTVNGSVANPFTWQGAYGVMQEGTTALYYMRARYFDSASARFLSRDPILSLDPREINPYQYADADPLGMTDPMGLKPGTKPPPGPPPPTLIGDAQLWELQNQGVSFLNTGFNRLNPFLSIDFDSKYHSQQTSDIMNPATRQPYENRVIFDGRNMHYGEFNYYYTAIYWQEQGFSPTVALASVFIWNKGTPTSNQVYATVAGYVDSATSKFGVVGTVGKIMNWVFGPTPAK